MKVFEDMNYYCVDNLPPTLIVNFAEICYQAGSMVDKVALGIDIRGMKFFEDLHESLRTLKRENYPFEILFLDCDDDTLLKRYKMTRRNHPLALNRQIPEGIKIERKILNPLKEIANYIVDTTNMKPKDLKEEILKIVLPLLIRLWFHILIDRQSKNNTRRFERIKSMHFGEPELKQS